VNRRQGKLIALCAGGVGLAGAAAGWILTPTAFPHAWLAAVTAWVGWPIGCMGLLLIHALTGGSWGYATRTQLVAGMSTLLLLPLAIIPLMIVLPHLYSWLRPDVATHLANSFYLNLPAFIARSIFYFIVWFGLAWSILRALRLDEHESALERIAPVGLILLAITVTFAAIDTTMSLDPNFSSSVYGLIAIVEMGLLALAVSIFGVAVGGPSDRKTLRDLGRLLLALVILWAYLDFVQLLIVWQSDLPNEASWYGVRLKGGGALPRRWSLESISRCPFSLCWRPGCGNRRSRWPALRFC
jgi:putative Mn2+ efflux pump MntP